MITLVWYMCVFVRKEIHTHTHREGKEREVTQRSKSALLSPTAKSVSVDTDREKRRMDIIFHMSLIFLFYYS